MCAEAHARFDVSNVADEGDCVRCRLVLLPHESHGYRARESIMHTLYEMDAWMERFCVATPSKL